MELLLLTEMDTVTESEGDGVIVCDSVNSTVFSREAGL